MLKKKIYITCQNYKYKKIKNWFFFQSFRYVLPKEDRITNYGFGSNTKRFVSKKCEKDFVAFRYTFKGWDQVEGIETKLKLTSCNF